MKIAAVFEDPLLRLGVVGSMLIAVYRGNATLEVLAELEKHQTALLHDFPKINNLSIVPDIARMARLDAQVKRRTVEMMQHFDGRVHGSATVILARGLGGAIVRTFMTGFSFASQAQSPARTFSDIPAAMAWLGTLPDQNAAFDDGPELIEAIAAFSA